MRASRSLRIAVGLGVLAALPFVTSVARGDAEETERRLTAVGVDAPIREKIHKAIDRGGTHCETCRIRNLCVGGCYHESYSRFGDAHHRTYHYCDLLRSWVDFGVRVYADIQRHNPSFFTRHLEPRSTLA